MARGIQENDVFEAADALLLEGQRPTIERVRQKIGRGSPNTVSPMLDLWFSQLGSRVRDPGAFAPAVAIPDPVGQAAKHFWETAQSLAREEAAMSLEVEKGALDDRATELSNTAALFETTKNNFLAKIAALDAALLSAEQQHESFRTRHVEQQAQIAAYQDENRVARALELELRAQLLAAENVLAETRRTADDRQRLSDERLDKAHARAALEIDRVREVNKQLSVDLKSAQTDVETGRSERLAAERHLSEAENKIGAIALEILRIGTVNRELVLELESQKASNETLLSALTNAQALLQAKDEEHGSLLRSLIAKSSPQRKKQASSTKAV